MFTIWHMYDYGLIGNCQVSALVHRSGSVDWLCFPRPDSPPVFGRMLDREGGSFDIEGADVLRSEQRYLTNTNVLLTDVELRDGSRYRITDFFPRFDQHGRTHRPMALFRILEPLAGTPTVTVRCKPVQGWEKKPLIPSLGSNHLRFEGFEAGSDALRLLTNMSLTKLIEGQPISVTGPIYFALTWGIAIEADLVQTSRDFLDRTIDYWKRWVKHCSIPTLFQQETIRSALALKLHCYEDTGAILAALTTSLPEENGTGRNWDYRYCWLRDSYFVLSAFHQLGHFEEMEGFLKFLLGIARNHEHSRDRLRPVYALDQSLPLPEYEHDLWRGFDGNLPVRSNNQAAEHVQNDVYGEMILTLAPIFMDERFEHLRTPEHQKLLVHLARFCEKSINVPDAGLWELRNGWQVHSFTNLMCWAGLERVDRIQKLGRLADAREETFDFAPALAAARASLSAASFGGVLRNGPKDQSPEAALSLLPVLRYPDAKLSRETVLAIAEELPIPDPKRSGAFLYRYKRQDDFGTPASSFLICSFWLIQALAKIGETGRAKALMDEVMGSSNSLGLLSEHYHPSDRKQLGNFPQGYSHVGQINAAFALSPAWDQFL